MDLAKHTRYWRCSSTAYITTNRPSSCDQMIVACLLLLEKHMRNWKRYRMLWNATTRHVVLVILKGQHFLNLQSNASDTSDFSLSIASWLPFCVVWTNKLLICTEQYVMTDTWLFYWLFINMHGTVNTVQKVSVCGQTIKSMIDGVRTETHEIIESCCVFLQSKFLKCNRLPASIWKLHEPLLRSVQRNCISLDGCVLLDVLNFEMFFLWGHVLF